MKLPISRMDETIENSLTRNIPLNNKTGSRGLRNGKGESKITKYIYIYTSGDSSPPEWADELSFNYASLSLIYHRRCRDRRFERERERKKKRRRCLFKGGRGWILVYPRLGCEHRWKTLEKTQVLSRSVARIQRCNPFISVWATRSIIPDKTSDSIVQPGNNATPRSRVLFSIIIRQVCIKLANCAKNLSFHQFFFLSELSLISQLFTHLSETKKISSLHNLSNSLEEDLLFTQRNRRSIKWEGKKSRRDRNLPEQIGRSVFWLIRFYWGAHWRARNHFSPSPLLVTGLTAVADPPVSLLPR